MVEKTGDFIHAAGGLLWRETEQGYELLVIHRKRYDDWSLPKGKCDADEDWQETALREVGEETAYQARIESFAGVTTYYHGHRPKVVLFWNMVPTGDYETPGAKEEIEPEVDRLSWLAVESALTRLTYKAERALVARNQLQMSLR